MDAVSGSSRLLLAIEIVALHLPVRVTDAGRHYRNPALATSST
jgi:hypothetical protein